MDWELQGWKEGGRGPELFSLSGHAVFIRLHFSQTSLLCEHTYACVDSSEYQVIHDMSYNHSLILWQALFLAGPCTVELTFIHSSLKSDERRKWVQRSTNPWNNLSVAPIFFTLVMFTCFPSFPSGDIQQLDTEVVDLTEFTKGGKALYMCG